MEVEGNKPFLLDDSESIWLVESGKMDIFSVQTSDGEIIGSRNHLFRAETGQALIGVNFSNYDSNIGLLASACSGTRLIKLKKTRLQDLSKTPKYAEGVTSIIDSWITGISSGIINSIPPKDYQPLEPGKEFSLEENSSASPDEGIVWVKLLAGKALFMGRENLSFESNGSYFPVSAQTWLQSVDKNKFQAIDTVCFLKEDPDWSGFNQFHRLITEGIVSNKNQTVEKEKKMLTARIENDRFFMKTAMSRLADILKIGHVKPAESDIDNGLFRACLAVGRSLGVTIIPHPDLKKGLKLQSPLRGILEASRIRMRNIILKDNWWEMDIGGAVLTYTEKDNRPVAILPTGSGKYKMYDPADESETLVTPQIALSLSGIAHSFYRSFPDQKLSGMDLLRFGLHGLNKEIKMVLIMGIAAGLLTMITPIATGKIFETIIPGAERGQLLQLSLALIVFAFAAGAFQIVRAVAMLRVEGKMDASVQAAVWDRLLNLPVPFFRNYSTGDLTQRAMGINIIRQALSGIVVQSILSLMAASFSFGLLFYYNVKMAFVALGLILTALTVTSTLSYFKVRHQRELAKIQGKISGMVLQFITGINKIRIANAENRVFNLWAKEFSEQKKVRFKAESLANHLAVFNSSFPVIATITIFFALTYFTQKALEAGGPPILSIGDFLAFNAAFTSFLMAMLGMTEALISALNIIPIYERSKPIFETLPEVDAAKSDPGKLSGTIETDQIYFKYEKDGPLILENLSLNIKSGEYIALVGSSGCGKSTLFRLLLGFETPLSGTIYYDGQDLAKLDVRSVRRQLGVVLQNGTILAGDIFTNIIGTLPLTLDDAWEAAKMAGLDKDISEMPMGMHTVLSEGAGTLSGGQRQRLLIARAIVHKPRIIYFDEATSALDNKTQAIVSKSLDNLKVTRVVIAHRLSTIINADTIFVFDKGKIVQRGNYTELIKQEGLFAELAKRQIA